MQQSKTGGGFKFNPAARPQSSVFRAAKPTYPPTPTRQVQVDAAPTQVVETNPLIPLTPRTKTEVLVPVQIETPLSPRIASTPQEIYQDKQEVEQVPMTMIKEDIVVDRLFTHSDGQPDIEGELVQHGYRVKDKIIVINSKGEREMRYIKAHDPLGHLVLVYLDVEGRVDITSNDRAISEGGDSLPWSKKISAYKCVQNQTCGIALQCKGQLCLLEGGPQAEAPFQKSYVYEYGVKGGEVDYDDYIALPIVRMSEIRMNPSLTMIGVDRVAKRFYADNIAKIQQGIDALAADMLSLSAIATPMVDSFSRVINTLFTDIQRFDSDYARATTESNEGLLNESSYNLSRRYEALDKSFYKYRRLAETRKKIQEINKCISEVNQVIEEVNGMENKVLNLLL